MLVLLFLPLVDCFLPEGFVHAPGGAVHSSCVYKWPEGTVLERSTSVITARLQNGTVVPVSPCRFPRATATTPLLRHQSERTGTNYSATPFPASSAPGKLLGYQGYPILAGYFPNPYGGTGRGPFTYFSADFYVPPAPKAPSTITYLWPGLEDRNGSFVLQPVLQFAAAPLAGSCSPPSPGVWDYRSFYVGEGTVHCGPGMRVEVAQAVTGVMSLSDGQWQVWSGNRSGLGYSLNVSGVLPQQFATCALEIWNDAVPGCGAFPGAGTLQFSDMVLQDDNGTLVPGHDGTDWLDDSKQPPNCGQKVVRSSPYDISLVFSALGRQ
mmetsp:Transcript_39234/g.77138  ORF Transcript_39234/g.77138 Transcript_39234/m.77138 type:complete len:323 (-) Transcript_39234:316-1284(-)|eukprot:CAMPEP_0175130854 /NCGR_PEP_ID=MMETSP0087-20121206/6223_1 /TAXON_ID=136419 /ORGANISM="Unknown Unknown, Strain D1" /LENGTH=322 /DNA_ID=CAMNT_0016413089 /DNA_START=42 /DNA_END=1010 /DNA_ORIENTATION=+